MSWRFVASSRIDAGVSLPSNAGATSSFEPLEKNSGAPHSSVSTWRSVAADHAVIGLAERGERQRVCRGSVEDEKNLTFRSRTARGRHRRLAQSRHRRHRRGHGRDWRLPSPPRPQGKFRHSCRWQIAVQVRPLLVSLPRINDRSRGLRRYHSEVLFGVAGSASLTVRAPRLETF